MTAARKTPLSLWLIVMGAIVLCVQPFDFVLNLVGFVLATVGGFSLIFLRRQVDRGRFIAFELIFIAALGMSFVNMGTLR